MSARPSNARSGDPDPGVARLATKLLGALIVLGLFSTFATMRPAPPDARATSGGDHLAMRSVVKPGALRNAALATTAADPVDAAPVGPPP